MKMLRRYREEAMDRPDLDERLLADDLRNLEVLNRFFGGQEVVRRRLAGVLKGFERGARLRVLDIGSGAGDLCRVVVEEARGAGVEAEVLSLDFHPQIQAFAQRQLADLPEVRFLRGDARAIPLEAAAVDLALCTLALHHFTEEGATAVLGEMRRVTRRTAIVSDLCRSPQAYAGVWFATRFMPNPMTRHDGPVSVQRAFTMDELQAMACAAGWTGAKLYREPWFRMSLVWGRQKPW